jgi:hypothetical protein
MTPDEKLSVFGDFDPEEVAEEAKERWGDTGEFAEAARRTDAYTADEWEAARAELDHIHLGLIALKDADVPADSPEAAVLVDEHRAHLSRWYYKVSPQTHEGLGQIYTTDPRFTESIDKAGEGLAAYLSDAIAARYA